MIFSPEMAFFIILSGIFVRARKMLNLSAGSGVLVDVEDVLLGSSEYSVRVVRLVSFHCIVL